MRIEIWTGIQSGAAAIQDHIVSKYHIEDRVVGSKKTGIHKQQLKRWQKSLKKKPVVYRDEYLDIDRPTLAQKLGFWIDLNF